MTVLKKTLGGVLTQKELAQAAENPLFAGVDGETLSALFAECVLLRFKAGEVISDVGEKGRGLGVVLSGAARVYKPAGGARMLMSVLRPGSLLGGATLFLPEAGAVTQIQAREDCAIAFFSEAALESAMRESFTLARNYMVYLTARVRFLTRRIESIAGSTAQDKLYGFLVRNAQKDVYELPRGMGELAEALRMSRASLYRVMDELVREGKIQRDGKTIHIITE